MVPENQKNKIIVLVVEDDEISFQLVKHLLEEIGIVALRAKSKTDVMNLIASDADFQLIVMDVILNGSENGYSIARELQAMQVNLPIVIVSAYSTAVLKPDRTKITNIKEVMEKPFNVDMFKKICLNLLSQ
jgi:CheY-like chemotaxis protein